MASDKYLNLLLLVGLFCTTVFWGCEDDECPDETNWECPDYDPCWDKEPVFADFTMYRTARARVWLQQDSFIAVPFERKTTYGDVNFSAIDRNATSYHWQVGDNPDNDRFTPDFSMSFPCSTVGEQIPVTLTVTRPGDTTCVDWTQTSETTTRILEIVSIEDTAIKGRYRGHLLSKPEEEYTFEVEYINCMDWANLSEDCFCSESVLVYHNLLNHGCSNDTRIRFAEYNFMGIHNFLSVNATHGCDLPLDYGSLQVQAALLRLNGEDSIRVDMDISYSQSPTIPFERTLEAFVGVREE
ncbi:hypothetical protein [Lewinella cohaerens]|uniref:hypothetical protein n=1 Tax=Lewinella cohaerens TaxID=70995 RepID=UPI000371525E|nr:hypothetical protein [Lewinella cohaerens]